MLTESGGESKNFVLRVSSWYLNAHVELSAMSCYLLGFNLNIVYGYSLGCNENGSRNMLKIYIRDRCQIRISLKTIGLK